MNFSDKYNINITNVATEVVKDRLDTRVTEEAGIFPTSFPCISIQYDYVVIVQPEGTVSTPGVILFCQVASLFLTNVPVAATPLSQ